MLQGTICQGVSLNKHIIYYSHCILSGPISVECLFLSVFVLFFTHPASFWSPVFSSSPCQTFMPVWLGCLACLNVFHQCLVVSLMYINCFHSVPDCLVVIRFKFFSDFSLSVFKCLSGILFLTSKALVTLNFCLLDFRIWTDFVWCRTLYLCAQAFEYWSRYIYSTYNFKEYLF